MKNLFLKAFSLVTTFAVLSSAYASNSPNGVTSEDPSLSPSGTEVVLSANFDGPQRIWIVGIDGNGLRKISKTVISTIENQPTWSPDGRRIAYVSTNGQGSEIWVMQADGTYATKLTASTGNFSHPAWSPDGKKIAFVSKGIWIMNADGSNPQKIVASSGGENYPSFSPLGDKIAFSKSTGETSTLMTANTDGSGVRSLTTGNFSDWEPHWGPNGIVFSSNRDSTSEHWKIFAIQPDGTGLRRLANTPGLSPRWMRDGRILFVNEMMNSKALSAVSILNPSNGGIQILVDVQGYFTPIDIRPGKAINRVNPRSHGKIEVAIFSTKTFDATKAVDQSTLTFGRTGNEKSLSGCSKKSKDINNDGLPDLKCRFWLGGAGFRDGDVIGILRFSGNDGTPYEGRDSITVVDKDEPEDHKDDD